jgi:hypothetical protein
MDVSGTVSIARYERRAYHLILQEDADHSRRDRNSLVQQVSGPVGSSS